MHTPTPSTLFWENDTRLAQFYESDPWFSFYKGKRVLVTGAGGFIPSHLTEALVLAGAEVTALVKYNGRGDVGNLSHLSNHTLKAISVVQGTITDDGHMRRLVQGKDVVFHLAALIGIPYSYVAPKHYVETNVVGTLNLLEACREHQVPLVHTSTSETYGTAQYRPINETHPLQGQSPYAASKIGADKLAESYARSFALPVTTLRPFNTYGPRQSTRAFIPTVIQQALAGSEVTVGSLLPKRDLSAVWDTVRGFMALGANIEAHMGEVVNVGHGSTQTMGDVLQGILRLMSLQHLPIYENTPERVRPEHSEVLELLADTTRAQQQLGWQPRLSLEEGLLATIGYFSQLKEPRLTAYHI